MSKKPSQKAPSQVDIAAHATALKAHTAALKANTKALNAHAAALGAATAARTPQQGDVYSREECINHQQVVWRYDDHLQPTVKSVESC